MEPQTPKIESSLPPELVARILNGGELGPEHEQLMATRDVVTKLTEVADLLSSDQEADATSQEEAKTLLSEIHQAILDLAAVEAPESPDVAQPIVDALSKLEAALTASVQAISITPTFKPSINVDSPAVTVQPAKVDLSGVENALSAMPAAFEAAIASIPEAPETDISPVTQALEAMLTKLESIDIGTRLKPQAPSTMKVTNPDGSSVVGGLITGAYDYVGMSNPDGNGNYQTFTYKTSGVNGIVIGTLTYTYDGSSNVTSVTRS